MQHVGGFVWLLVALTGARTRVSRTRLDLGGPRLWIWVVALVTLGSGVIDLFSVVNPDPERTRLLREIFPLALVHLSRFLTLLIGFALVISSINIVKRKKRAFHLVLGMAAAAVVLHLTKGIDYEEALFSLFLVVLLLLTRRHFTVESSPPDLAGGMVRFAAALTVALLYGIVGFWLLDPRHFGIDFNWKDSIRDTLLFLSFIGDPRVVPHTRYAQWFLNSLSLMTVTAMLYAGFALFRPVIYRLRTHPREIDLATAIVRECGRAAQDYFKLWPDKSYFFSPSGRSFLAYTVGRNFAVVLGDPVGPEVEIEEIVRRFREFCQHNDWGLAFHQTLPDFISIYRRLGFKKLKIGDDAIVDLAQFQAGGKKSKELKRVRQFDKMGLRTGYHEPPVPDDVLSQLQNVSDEWLLIPGRRERRFTLGWFDRAYVRSTPVLTVLDPDGQVLAFVNMVPSPVQGETAIDLMRRRTEAPSGVMDYLFIKLFLHSRERGFTRLNLGMAPMAGFQEREQASPEERAIHFFFQHLNFLFSYRGLRAYKAKFATCWEPRYAVYRKVFDLPRLALALGKVSEIEGEQAWPLAGVPTDILRLDASES